MSEERHTGIRIEEMLKLTHHSFIAYTLPTTGEVVPTLQVAPSKTDAERLLLVSHTTCSNRPGARPCRSCSNAGTTPRTGH
ncbi:hypothetical protein [Streptomyces sp. NPDC006551]|uniref:hypothetical protein n=1 Tax=Streptomyces sp. NPDC006551 TaxID=3157178 RepID=UPI0033B99552